MRFYLIGIDGSSPERLVKAWRLRGDDLAWLLVGTFLLIANLSGFVMQLDKWLPGALMSLAAALFIADSVHDQLDLMRAEVQS